MKLKRFTPVFILLLSLVPSPALGQALRIERMAVSVDVVDREPVDVRDLFPSSLEKVYCFVEARDIISDTYLTFVWFYRDKEVAQVRLPVRKGPRWRTYSSKRIKGLKGHWRVEVRDEGGRTLRSIDFRVE